MDDHLPVELFFRIIGNLIYDQRLKCRSVCRRWKQLIDDFKLNSLVVCDRFQGIATQRWFDNNASVDIRNVLMNEDFKLLSSLSSKRLLSNVRELAIYNLDRANGSTSFESILNSTFRQVQKLDLYEIKDVKRTLSINLPDLRALCVDDVYGDLLINSDALNSKVAES